MQVVCFWCCVLPDFAVQINNFVSLVLFSAAIHKGRGKKLSTLSKIIKWRKEQMEGRRLCSLRHYDAICTRIDMWFTPYFNILGRPRIEYVIKTNFITFQTVNQEIVLILIWLYKGMGLDFVYEIFRKIVLMLFSLGWPNFIVGLPLLCEMLGNMCM